VTDHVRLRAMLHNPEPLDFVCDALAVYRLTRLFAQDEITETARDWLVDWFTNHDHPKLAILAGCPYCQSVYFAAGVALARTRWPRAWNPVSRFLAAAGAAAIIVAALTPPEDR
jgi:hypothetical protein